MNRPIYKQAQGHVTRQDPHKGLWFERFFDRYGSTWKVLEPNKETKSSPKLDWINSVTGKTGDAARLERHKEKTEKFIKSLGGDFKIVKNDWRFISGTGLPHPVENGFSWHPTLAVPYLPGAAIKGILRSYFDAGWAEKPKEGLLSWFGSDGKAPEKQTAPLQAGNLIFFDALPIKPVNLVADIMTPHMGEWYADGHNIKSLEPLETGTNGQVSEEEKTRRENVAKRLPADWHDPTPIPFLVAERPTFLLGVAPRPGATGNVPKISVVMEYLLNALDWLGAGAKTAVGYGQFIVDESRPASPAEKWLSNEREKLAKQHYIKPEDTWWGRPLANSWSAINDDDGGDVKTAVLNIIIKKWTIEGWWNKKKIKGAMKAAKNIYETANLED